MVVIRLTRQKALLHLPFHSHGCCQRVGPSLGSAEPRMCRRIQPCLDDRVRQDWTPKNNMKYLLSMVVNFRVAHKTSSVPARRLRHSCRQEPCRRISNILRGKQKYSLGRVRWGILMTMRTRWSLSRRKKYIVILDESLKTLSGRLALQQRDKFAPHVQLKKLLEPLFFEHLLDSRLGLTKTPCLV